MQKIYVLDSSYQFEVDKINNNYLSKGWVIKQTIIADKNKQKTLLLLEKNDRKEKLENLDNLKQT